MQILTANDADKGDGDAKLAAPASTDPAVNSGSDVEMVPMPEAELAAWLVDNPEFFLRFGHVLAEVRIHDQNAGRAISLHERQLEVLRDKHRQLERNLGDLVRMGQENDELADRVSRFTRDLLLVRNPAEMPARIEAALSGQFRVPQVALRLWHVTDEYRDQPFAAPPAKAELRRYFDEMTVPYCGLKNDMTPVDWLAEQGDQVRSVALLPLRTDARPEAAGVIVLASSDADRFQAGMGTAFLDRISEIASAALSRLMPQEPGVVPPADN